MYIAYLTLLGRTMALIVSVSNSRAPGSNEHGFETCERRIIDAIASFICLLGDFLARSLAPVAAATTPKAGFHANRCPHAKSDGTLHLDARQGGFVGAIEWATKRQHSDVNVHGTRPSRHDRARLTAPACPPR